MIVPHDEYTLRDYLVDAGRAWRRYWSHQRQIYFPPYGGIKVHYTPLQWVGRVLGACANVALVLAILWVVSPH